MAAPLGDIKGRGKDRDWGSRVNDELREAVLRVGRMRNRMVQMISG